jgi:hypothetical protein
MTEQFQLCEWRHCHLGKLFRCSKIMSGSWDGCTWLPKLSTYSLAVIWPWRVTMVPTEYSTMKLLPKTSQNLPRVSLLEPGFLGSSPHINSSWCKEQREGRLIWLHHACVSICLMSRFYGRDTIVYTAEHYFQ